MPWSTSRTSTGGAGLAGVPRGTVKSLRLFSFDYGYRGLANHTHIGIDGPWDVHWILGTVPVESDYHVLPPGEYHADTSELTHPTTRSYRNFGQWTFRL